MKEYLIKFRDQIIFELWETCKNRVTMEEIAEVFNIPLKTAYRIILKRSKLKKLIKK